ncbi:MAG: hypothetical protein MUE50_22935 [Pirellulaceae bacterium]|nr:hypothetical protein [Pirellulaceae bacterium]
MCAQGHAILLTGYQDDESPGRALLDLARSEGPKPLRLAQSIVPVACLFVSFSGGVLTDLAESVE